MIRRGAALLAGALLLLARVSAAQVDTTRRRPAAPLPSPPVAGRDTTKRDSTARDTTPPDTLAHFLPPFPTSSPEGPFPRGTRYSYPVDSLVLNDVMTLSDLLVHVPGVYIGRGGFFGQSEVAFYGGRGAQGLDVYWDGVPYLPLGRDSVFLDPARIPLAPLERVDVIVLPATLRVYLITARQRSTIPVTMIRILTGEFNISGYRGLFAKRWKSGAGLSIAADWSSINGDRANSSTQFSSVDLWIKGEYVPSAKIGASYQVLASSFNRQGLTGSVSPWKARRDDRLFRFFLASRADGLGPRLEGAITSTDATGDSAIQKTGRSLYQARLGVQEAWGRGLAELSASTINNYAPTVLEARAAWAPLPPLALAADARYATYEHARYGRRLHAAAGVRLPLGFSLHGDAAWAHDLQAPLLRPDTAQTTADYSGAVRWDTRPITLEAGRARRDAFAPIGFPLGLVGSDSLNALGVSPHTDYITLHGSLRPLPGVELSGWYFDPVVGGGDFEPPYHGRMAITFYSKFWRRFRSGVFALRGEYALESWTRGLGGRHFDSASNTSSQVTLPGGSFQEFNMELRLVGVTAFWVVRNNAFFRGTYVQGLGYPRRGQFYGVRWEFHN